MFANRALPATRTTHTDEHLQRWADIYVGRGVLEYGVRLEYFLLDPQPIIDAIDSGRMLRLDEIVEPRELLAGAR